MQAAVIEPDTGHVTMPPGDGASLGHSRRLGSCDGDPGEDWRDPEAQRELAAKCRAQSRRQGAVSG